MRDARETVRSAIRRALAGLPECEATVEIVCSMVADPATAWAFRALAEEKAPLLWTLAVSPHSGGVNFSVDADAGGIACVCFPGGSPWVPPVRAPVTIGIAQAAPRGPIKISARLI